MNRRALFGKLGAVAAAAIVAPAVQAEAASGATIIETPDIGVPVDAALHVHGKTVLEGDLIVNGVSITDAIADARAEGYTRGWDVRDAAAESTAMRSMRDEDPDRRAVPYQYPMPAPTYRFSDNLDVTSGELPELRVSGVTTLTGALRGFRT